MLAAQPAGGPVPQLLTGKVREYRVVGARFGITMAIRAARRGSPRAL